MRPALPARLARRFGQALFVVLVISFTLLALGITIDITPDQYGSTSAWFGTIIMLAAIGGTVAGFYAFVAIISAIFDPRFRDDETKDLITNAALFSILGAILVAPTNWPLKNLQLGFCLVIAAYFLATLPSALLARSRKLKAIQELYRMSRPTWRKA